MDAISAHVLEIAQAFMRSRAILSASELDLFTRLGRKRAAAEETARELGLDPRGTARLMDALVALGLLEKQAGRYGTTAQGTLLSAAHPESVLPMVLHLGRQWRLWSGLTEAVARGGSPDRQAPHFTGEDQKNFIGAMHVAGRALAREIAAAYDTGPFRRLLDVGGGSGSYTIAFLERNPSLQGTLFDLEEVIPLADQRLRAEGLRARVELVGGNFYEDELPRGCDLALLSAIVHQNGPDENVELYRKVLRALEPGGVLLIRDFIMDESRTVPAAGTLFALNMLVSTRRGDTYTFAEVRDTLERAGFGKVRQVRGGQLMDALVEARAPGA
ncbi:MAG: methyltransferase [bacterium]